MSALIGSYNVALSGSMPGQIARLKHLQMILFVSKLSGSISLDFPKISFMEIRAGPLLPLCV